MKQEPQGLVACGDPHNYSGAIRGILRTKVPSAAMVCSTRQKRTSYTSSTTQCAVPEFLFGECSETQNSPDLQNSQGDLSFCTVGGHGNGSTRAAPAQRDVPEAGRPSPGRSSPPSPYCGTQEWDQRASPRSQRHTPANNTPIPPYSSNVCKAGSSQHESAPASCLHQDQYAYALQIASSFCGPMDFETSQLSQESGQQSRPNHQTCSSPSGKQFHSNKHSLSHQAGAPPALQPTSQSLFLSSVGGGAMALHRALQDEARNVEEVEQIVQSTLLALKEADPCEDVSDPSLALAKSARMLQLVFTLAQVKTAVLDAKRTRKSSPSPNLCPLHPKGTSMRSGSVGRGQPQPTPGTTTPNGSTPAAPPADGAVPLVGAVHRAPSPAVTDLATQALASEMVQCGSGSVTSRRRAQGDSREATPSSAPTETALASEPVRTHAEMKVAPSPAPVEPLTHRGRARWLVRLGVSSAERTSRKLARRPSTSVAVRGSAEGPRPQATLRRVPSAGTLAEAATLVGMLAAGSTSSRHKHADSPPSVAGCSVGRPQEAPASRKRPIQLDEQLPAATRIKVEPTCEGRTGFDLPHRVAGLAAEDALKIEPGAGSPEQLSRSSVGPLAPISRLNLQVGPPMRIQGRQDQTSLPPAAAARLAAVARRLMARSDSMAGRTDGPAVRTDGPVATGSRLVRTDSMAVQTDAVVAAGSRLVRTDSMAVQTDAAFAAGSRLMRADPMPGQMDAATRSPTPTSPAQRPGSRPSSPDSATLECMEWDATGSPPCPRSSMGTPVAGKRGRWEAEEQPTPFDTLISMLAIRPRSSDSGAGASPTPVLAPRPVPSSRAAVSGGGQAAISPAVNPATPAAAEGCDGRGSLKQQLSHMRALLAEHAGLYQTASPAKSERPEVAAHAEPRMDVPPHGQCSPTMGRPARCSPALPTTPVVPITGRSEGSPQATALAAAAAAGKGHVYMTPLVLDIAGRRPDGRLLHRLHAPSGLTPATPDGLDARRGQPNAWPGQTDGLQLQMVRMGQLLAARDAMMVTAAGVDSPPGKRARY